MKNDISIDSNFFEIGGNSLLSAKVVNYIRNELGYSTISIRDFFLNPTIEKLALFLNDKKSIQPSSRIIKQKNKNEKDNFWKKDWETRERKIIKQEFQIQFLQACFNFWELFIFLELFLFQV